jgi:hypothetical protein
MQMNRFDYVKYDETAMNIQDAFKRRVIDMEEGIEILLVSPRAKALALTKLEEVYMWIGKAIRDDQIMRTKDFELQEERDNG